MSEELVPKVDGTVRVHDGARLRFSVFSTGIRTRRVALIHSLALSRDFWARVVPKLVGHADVLTYDCRGHGESDAVTKDFTTPQFADDLADLLEALGWSRTLVAGCSMGGNIAQEFAASYPERVSGSVFCDTTQWYGAEAPATWRERAEKARTGGMAELVPFQLSRWFGSDFADAHPDVVEGLTSTFVANDLDAYAATCRMLGDADLRALAPRIERPCAVVVGAEDYATPPDMAKQLAESIGATLTVLPDAKHLTPVERPDEVAAAILDTLDRAEG